MNNIINRPRLKFWTLTIFCLLFASINSYADPIVKKNRSVDKFSGIKVGGAFNVVLTQGSTHKLVIEAEEDVHDDIRTQVKGDVLHIDIDWNWKWKNHGKITIYVDFVALDYLNVSGAADVTTNTPIKANELELQVSGASDLELEINAKSMNVTVSGAGDIRISGSTDEQTVRLSGAGDYKASQLKSNYTNARASGAGSVTVHATEQIEAYASGAGSVKYYGNPAKEKTNSSGAGTIRKGRD